jgi:hypothetical protein
VADRVVQAASGSERFEGSPLQRVGEQRFVEPASHVGRLVDGEGEGVAPSTKAWRYPQRR